MSPTVITFDCAQTLLDVAWSPADLAMQCSAIAGLTLEPTAAQRYMRLLQGRIATYGPLNRTRDRVVCESFWATLAGDWLADLGQPQTALPAILDAADALLYGPESPIFRLFPDTKPCLERLVGRNVRLAVVSNWDFSLHRVLESQGLTGYFERVFASLEEGVEKPYPELFWIAARELGVRPEQILHIGDSTLDDLLGAREAGCGALLLDRDAMYSDRTVLRSLDDLDEVLACA